MHLDDDEYENDRKGQELMVNHLLPGIRLQSALPRWWSAARGSRRKRPVGIVIMAMEDYERYERGDIGRKTNVIFFKTS